MAKLIPGILTKDEGGYVEWLRKAEHAAGLVQVDIIDGLFAPNKTIVVDVVKRNPPSCLLEIQLIVKNPEKYIREIDGLNFVSRVVFPYETENVKDNIYLLKKSNKQVGVSINPETGVADVFGLADSLDFLCIFSASPGFSGRKLEDSVYSRIRESKELLPNLPVEVDIGVNFETAPKLVAAGADFLVATSALVGADDFYTAYGDLAKSCQSAR